jgi:hypothetical protein
VISFKRSARRRWWALGLVGVLAVAAGVAVTYSRSVQVYEPGPELDASQGGAYGWHKAMDVGTVFTDGLIHIELSGASTSPMTIISVTPLMDNGPALRVLGTKVRVIPDMLPPDSELGWFEYLKGYPPAEKYATGGVDPAGFRVRPTNGDDDVSVEIQVGYEVVAAGTSNRAGVEVVYEYEGVRKRVIIPSYLTICAPASAPCEAKTP